MKIKIDKLALEGDGIGRTDDNKVAFVPYALPGETVEATLLLQKKSYARWLPQRIVSTSPERIDSPCPYHFKAGRAGLWCGGCDWQHMGVEAQKNYKRLLVQETLERIGGLTNPVVNETTASPTSTRYRNKVQVPFRLSKNGVKAGFYAPNSHDVVEFDDCLVQSDLSLRIFHTVKKAVKNFSWPIYDEDSGRGWLRHLLIRTNTEGKALVALVTASQQFKGKEEFITGLRNECPEVIGIHQNIQSKRTNVILGAQWVRLWGQDKLEEKMAGLKLSYSIGSFFQVNTGAAERLYLKAIEELRIDSSMVVVDLYCGVGALALLAARAAKLVIGVEEAPSSIRDAKDNAQKNGLRNVEFIMSSVENAFKDRWRDVFHDLAPQEKRIIVDPPRSGCDPAVINELLKLKAGRLVYVSCNPATLARDLKLLSASYKLVSATPVDLFPQTSHIEVVATLDLLS